MRKPWRGHESNKVSLHKSFYTDGERGRMGTEAKFWRGGGNNRQAIEYNKRNYTKIQIKNGLWILTYGNFNAIFNWMSASKEMLKTQSW